jgi:hypothetical protein
VTAAIVGLVAFVLGAAVGGLVGAYVATSICAKLAAQAIVDELARASGAHIAASVADG